VKLMRKMTPDVSSLPSFPFLSSFLPYSVHL
jgi:hypothetical protein